MTLPTYAAARRIVADRARSLGYLVKRGKRLTVGIPDARGHHDRDCARLSIRNAVHRERSVLIDPSGTRRRWEGSSLWHDVRDLATSDPATFARCLSRWVGFPPRLAALDVKRRAEHARLGHEYAGRPYVTIACGADLVRAADAARGA